MWCALWDKYMFKCVISYIIKTPIKAIYTYVHKIT